MNRTKYSDLLKILLLTFLAGTVVARLGFLPITITTPIALGLLVVAMLIWIINLNDRLPKLVKSDNDVFVKASSNPLAPQVAARTVAFALAGSRTGAILFGVFAGVAAVDLFRLQIAAYASRAIYCGISAGMSFLMILLSLWLEHKCSPPKPKPIED